MAEGEHGVADNLKRGFPLRRSASDRQRSWRECPSVHWPRRTAGEIAGTPGRNWALSGVMSTTENCSNPLDLQYPETTIVIGRSHTITPWAQGVVGSNPIAPTIEQNRIGRQSEPFPVAPPPWVRLDCTQICARLACQQRPVLHIRTGIHSERRCQSNCVRRWVQASICIASALAKSR